MKLPRDISAKKLTKSVLPSRYVVTKQKGSHIRLKAASNEVHLITISNHNPVKPVTLSSTFGDIAAHFKLTKE